METLLLTGDQAGTALIYVLLVGALLLFLGLAWAFWQGMPSGDGLAVNAEERLAALRRASSQLSGREWRLSEALREVRHAKAADDADWLRMAQGQLESVLRDELDEERVWL